MAAGITNHPWTATELLHAIALIVVAAAGLWIVGVAFLTALRPRYCLHLFER